MRAVTVRQPWAWAIVHGGKDVENRTRNLAGSYRGPVAIHAGLTPDTAAQGSWPLGDLIPTEAWKVRGAIIGVVDLVDAHSEAPFCCGSWAQRVTDYGGAGGLHHMVLKNPRPLEVPIPARAMLGLWTPPPVVLEQLQAVTQ